MTGLKKISLCSVIGILALMVFLTMAHSNGRAGNTALAQEEYQKGKRSFDAERWEEAISHFKRSYDAVPHPQTAYLMSCIFVKLEEAGLAHLWATLALKGSPSLNDPYKKGAQDIIAWAEKKLKGPPPTSSIYLGIAE